MASLIPLSFENLVITLFGVDWSFLVI